MQTIDKVILSVLVLTLAAAGQQSGTASTSLNVQSSVQVNPADPRYLVTVYSLPPAKKPPSAPERQTPCTKSKKEACPKPAEEPLPPQKPDQAPKPCGFLPQQPKQPTTNTKTQGEEAGMLNAAAIVPLLGNPDPFSFVASGTDKLLIYSRRPLNEKDKKLLHSIQDQIAELRDPKTFPHKTKTDYTVELSIPHASALGDLTTLVNSLGFSDFTAQNIGKDRVKITSSGPDCDALTAFYWDLRRVIWRPQPENSVYRVFYMNAPDALGAVGGSGGAPSSQAGSASPQTAGTPASATTQPSAQAGGASPQQSGGTTTTSITVGATSPTSSSQAASAGSGTSAAASKTAGASTPAGTGQSTPSPSAGGNAGGSAGASAVGNDFLVFSDAVPGDDATITARERIISQLDLPRPEMIINVWVAQKSSTRAEKVLDDNTQLRQVVRNFNDALQDAIGRGWISLKKQIADKPAHEPDCGYFNCGFRNYIAFPAIAEPLKKSNGDSSPPHPEQVLAQNFLQYDPSATINEGTRKTEEICPVDAYCLGYRSLFSPLKPRLTDLLLTAIAAQKADKVIRRAIDEMERHALDGLDKAHVSERTCDEKDRLIYQCWKWREAKRRNPNEGLSRPNQCAEDIPEAMQENPKMRQKKTEDIAGLPTFGLECFRAEADQILKDVNPPQPINLIRAAAANFLFHYKMSQQYPHDFVPYELSQSAQAFNTALSPLIDAFNRDLANFQTALINGFTKSSRGDDSGNWIGAERPSFNNNGFITVRTVSGIDTKVNTTTQNFLDATQQPIVADLLKSINASATSTKSTGGTLFQNISPIQAQVIMGAINSVQSSKVQIGRGLNIDVTPRSLSGASSAEIAVTINADESAAPTFFGGNLDTKNADISRVAQHDTTTRVRVDSIKLFEVSTLTAELDKSRTRFPIIPPFVEIPYVGSLIGWPLPHAKEYHSSVVVLSAVVVPTAADLAYGIEFTLDRLITTPSKECSLNPQLTKLPLCGLIRAAALSDLHGAPIFSFHQRMVECLAMGGWRDGSNNLNGCEKLTFGLDSNAPRENQ